jgi:hypothetical protein
MVASPIHTKRSGVLKPDLEQARRHLQLLGYEQKDKLYLREFAGKPQKFYKGVKPKTYEARLNGLPTMQHPGRGVYFTVNGYGHTDEDVESCRALFGEWDDIPHEEQLAKVTESGLPEPTCQVLTRNSIHHYWLFDEPVSVEEWRELTLDAIAHFGWDRKNKNPSRVLRVAGYHHVAKDKETGQALEPFKCELISDGGQRYSFADIRAAIPPRPQEELLGNNQAVNPAIPFPNKIVDGSRQLSDILHADILPRLSAEQIFTWSGHQFQWSGQDKARGCCPWHESQSGSSFHIEPNGENGAWLWECGGGCDRGGGAVEYVFQHELGGHGSPRGKDFVEVVKILADRAGVELPKFNPHKPTYAESHRSRETVTGDQVVSGRSPHQKQGIASNTGETVTGDPLLEEDLVTGHDWDALKASMELESFNPFQVMPRPLADKAGADAAKLNIDPLALWQYFLPATLSLMGRETVLDMSGWRVPNIIWSMLIQESGTGKSRAKDIVTAPLQKWDSLEHEYFLDRYQQYQVRLKEYAKSKEDDGPPPEKPNRRKFVFNVATPQGLVRRLADQEDNGVLWCRDELKGLFNSLDQFTGQGEGLEILLETWDGKPSAVDRVDVENSYIVPESRLSVCGGIQPGVIEKTFDVEDSQGVLARFLVASPKELPVKRVKGAALLADELPLLYGFIKNTPWEVIKPTDEADDLFTEIVETFGNERPPIAAARPWLRKLAGQTARLAIAIHAVECYYNRQKHISILTRDTLERAYWMAQQYKHHFYHLIGVTASNGLSGILAQIQERAAAHPEGIAIRSLYQGIKKIRQYAKLESIPIGRYTLKLCEELASMGYGEVTQVGKSKIYIPNSSPAPQSRSPVTVSPESVDKYGGLGGDSTVTDRSPVTVSQPPAGVSENKEEDQNNSLYVEAQKPPGGMEVSATREVDPDEEALGNKTPAHHVETFPNNDLPSLDEVEWLEEPEESDGWVAVMPDEDGGETDGHT